MLAGRRGGSSDGDGMPVEPIGAGWLDSGKAQFPGASLNREGERAERCRAEGRCDSARNMGRLLALPPSPLLEVDVADFGVMGFPGTRLEELGA